MIIVLTMKPMSDKMMYRMIMIIMVRFMIEQVMLISHHYHQNQICNVYTLLLDKLRRNSNFGPTFQMENLMVIMIMHIMIPYQIKPIVTIKPSFWMNTILYHPSNLKLINNIYFGKLV